MSEPLSTREGTPASELVGGPVIEYIASKLTSNVSRRGVREECPKNLVRNIEKRAFVKQWFARYVIAIATDQWGS